MSNQCYNDPPFPGFDVMPHCGQIDSDGDVIQACRNLRPCAKHGPVGDALAPLRARVEEYGKAFADLEEQRHDLEMDRDRWKGLCEDAFRRIEEYERGHWREFLQVCAERDAAEAALDAAIRELPTDLTRDGRRTLAQYVAEVCAERATERERREACERSSQNLARISADPAAHDLPVSGPDVVTRGAIVALRGRLAAADELVGAAIMDAASLIRSKAQDFRELAEGVSSVERGRAYREAAEAMLRLAERVERGDVSE